MSFDRHPAAYKRMFERCGVDALRRRGGVRDHGRDGVASASWRRRARARTSSCTARTATTSPTSRPHVGSLEPPSSLSRLEAPEEVETPGVETIEALAELLGIDTAATSKAMPVVQRRHARARARTRRRPAGEEKLYDDLPVRPGPPTTRRSATRSARTGGRSGRSAFEGRHRGRDAASGQFVAGANRDGWHLRGVEAGRDYEPRFADICRAPRRRRVPGVRWTARVQPAIEVGHIFKLGTFHSAALEGDVPRRGRDVSSRSRAAATGSGLAG